MMIAMPLSRIHREGFAMERSGSGLSRSRFSIFTLLFLFAILPWGRAAQAATVDVMLVYDTTATTWVGSNGGMAAFSQDVVNRMNLAMQNTGVSISFRLVHSMSVDYTTKSSLSTPLSADLSALQAGSGAFAAVAAARDTYGADLVAMLIDHGYDYGYVGQGYLLSSWSGHANYAHTVNAIRSVAISHTLTHEVGHNLGAHHSKYQTSDPGPNADLDGVYSAGWYFTGTNGTDYHTIMAYNDDGHGNNYQEAPLFSTPLRIHQGVPAGDANNGDNARLLRETGDIVAAYRASVNTTLPTVPVALAATDITSTSFMARWSAVSGATGYRLNYTQHYEPQDLGWFDDIEIDLGNATSTLLSGLNPGSGYFYRVQAYNDSGASDYSNIVYVVTGGAAVAPAAPVAISATDVTSSGFTARWNSVSGATGYWLDVSTNSSFGFPGESFDTKLGDLTSSEVKWDDRPNTTFYYRVRAYNDSGFSGYSNTIAVTTSGTGVLDDPYDFTAQQYLDFLGRPGESAGINYWSALLQNGSVTRAQVVDSFFGSAEFQDNIAPLARLYFAYFDRIPDYAGLNYWIQQFRAGAGLGDMSQAFAESAEFIATYGALDDAEFVDLVYQNVLGRAPETTGRDFWIAQLENGVTRGEMMIGFSESSEYRGRSDSWVQVTMMYIGMLRRAPETSGFDFWVEELEAGRSVLELINGFLVSDEYATRF